VVGSSRSVERPQSARRLGTASIVLSVIGLVFGIIIYIIVAILLIGTAYVIKEGHCVFYYFTYSILSE